MPSRSEPEDPRARYGLEPDPPEEVARLRELIPGADEWHRVPLHPSVADKLEAGRRDVEREG